MRTRTPSGDMTVRDLLAHPALRGARVAGGAAGLHVVVRVVTVVSRPGAAQPGTLLVLVAGPQSTGLDVDIALRVAADDRAAAVLLPAHLLAPSTARIADRLAIPAIVHDAQDAHRLAHVLEALVVAPRAARAETLLATARSIRGAGADVAAATAALSRLLAAPIAIVDADGAAIAGAPVEPPEGLLADRTRTLPSATGLLVGAPLSLDETAPEAWLVAGPVEAGPARAATIAAALELAAAGLAGAFARRRLAAERDARLRSGLLAELLAQPGPPPPQLAARVVAAGWRAAGWHVGVHLAARALGATEIATATPHIEAALDAHGVDGPVVQAPDGWSAWWTLDTEPDPQAYAALVRRVRALVRDESPGLVLHAGVGAAHPEAQGIAKTVGEARHASVLATAAGPRGAVEHAGALGARRLLLGWYGSEAFSAYAETLLAPLRDAGEEALLQTLAAYLDHESSTAATAALLGVHRNTVTHRIRRVEELLGVNLARPDERLTLQLACRLVRLRERAPDGT